MPTALYSQIVTKTRDLIAGLSLTGLSSANIVETKVPWARDMTMPGIRVSYERDKIIPKMNNSYDVDYGVWVVYARVSNQDLTGAMDTPNAWRQAITRYFQAKEAIAAFGITEVYNCRVEAGTPLWDKGFAAQHDVGALKIIVTTREPR